MTPTRLHRTAAAWHLGLVAALMSAGPVLAQEAPTPEAMALRVLDGEALYTVAGGLKPVSEGFWRTELPEDRETSPDVDEARRVLAGLPLGPGLDAGVYVFATPFGGRCSASAFVAHRPSLAALIARRPDLFGPLGVTPDAWPQQVLEAIDRGPPSARWRAFGLAFGYPEYAVEFFVAAGERQAATGRFVERDFLNLPTFAEDRGRFVYAVPMGHAERNEDRNLRARSDAILQGYRARREAYVGDGKAGAVALLRDWITPPPATKQLLCHRPGCPLSSRSTWSAPRRFCLARL